MGKSYKWPFSIAMLNYHGVYTKLHEAPCFLTCFRQCLTLLGALLRLHPVEDGGNWGKPQYFLRRGDVTFQLAVHSPCKEKAWSRARRCCSWTGGLSPSPLLRASLTALYAPSAGVRWLADSVWEPRLNIHIYIYIAIVIIVGDFFIYL